MTVDLLGESLPFTGGIQRMEAASVKGEAEWRSLNVALQKFRTAKVQVTLAWAAFSLPFSIAISALSTPTTVKFCCESQIALSPVPHPISSALQGAIGVVVTA